MKIDIFNNDFIPFFCWIFFGYREPGYLPIISYSSEIVQPLAIEHTERAVSDLIGKGGESTPGIFLQAVDGGLVDISIKTDLSSNSDEGVFSRIIDDWEPSLLDGHWTQ